MKRAVAVLAGVLALAMAMPAMAHFQMIYTPESALASAKPIDLKLVFTHPFEAGHTMDMGQPEQFFRCSQRKEKRSARDSATDYLDKPDQQRRGLRDVLQAARHG